MKRSAFGVQHSTTRSRVRWVPVILGLFLVGCTGGPPQARTTFLRSVDLVAMIDQMAAAFASDELISERTTSDPPWVISFDRVVNHTNQIIPDREKWLYIARLRALLAQSDVGQMRHLIWIIPPERWNMVAEELGVSEEPYGLRMNPTHLLTAEFTALTNTTGGGRAAGGRSDLYHCAYELVELSSGLIVWEDRWEVKRWAAGITYD